MTDNRSMVARAESSPPEFADRPQSVARQRLIAFARRGLITQALCAGIAVVFWLMVSGSGGFGLSWLYSALIGNFSWLFIDGGRQLLARVLRNGRAARSGAWGNWPGASWMIACILLGTVAGYSLGSSVARK